MNCTICKNGTTSPGVVTVTLQQAGSIIVFKNVNAQVCENCGEYYLDEQTSQKLFEQASASIKHGAEVEICHLQGA